MKITFIILTLFTFTKIFADNPCHKCDIDKIVDVQTHIDSLTIEIISDFLCTFDSSCFNNAEYSEFSNETLFKILESEPDLFFQVISKEKFNNDLYIKVVENPIHDLIDLQNIYDKIKVVSAPQKIKSQYLNALIVAASKSKNKIHE